MLDSRGEDPRANADGGPGQRNQIGPCTGLRLGDHLSMVQYIRESKLHDCVSSISPDPAEEIGAAPCHTNFSMRSMREKEGFGIMVKVIEAFDEVAAGA